VVRQLTQSGFDPTWERVETSPALSAALHRQLWDIIIADHNMPHPAALALAQKLGGDVPFLIVSGGISEELAVAFMKQGATDYLFKDRLGRLGVAVELDLDQRRLREENGSATNSCGPTKVTSGSSLNTAPTALDAPPTTQGTKPC
jgi:DNA-binding NtrC family response regulator